MPLTASLYIAPADPVPRTGAAHLTTAPNLWPCRLLLDRMNIIVACVDQSLDLPIVIWLAKKSLWVFGILNTEGSLFLQESGITRQLQRSHGVCCPSLWVLQTAVKPRTSVKAQQRSSMQIVDRIFSGPSPIASRQRLRLAMLGSRKRQRTMEERLLGGGGAEGGGEKVGRLELDAPPAIASGDGAEGGIDRRWEPPTAPRAPFEGVLINGYDYCYGQTSR
eukprot:COSAG04_NODE_173_length_21572_cov_104.574256_10_plen_221_part_00